MAEDKRDSSPRVEFMDFSTIDQTSGEHGSSGLKDINSGVPFNGAISPVRVFDRKSSITSATPVVSVHAHQYQEDLDLQLLYPVSSQNSLPALSHPSVKPFTLPSGADETAFLATVATMVGEGAQDESTYIFAPYSMSSNPVATPDILLAVAGPASLPADKTNWVVRFAYRLQGGTASSIDITFRETFTVRSTKNITPTPDGEWVEDELALTTPEATAVTGITGWSLKFLANITATNQAERPSGSASTRGVWVNELGTTASLHDSLDSSDATYVESPVIVPGNQEVAVYFDVDIEDPRWNSTDLLQIRAKGTNTGILWRVEVEALNRGETIFTGAERSASDSSFTNVFETIPFDRAGDLQRLRVCLFAYSTATGTTETSVSPASTGLNEGWDDNVGNAIDMHTPVSDASDITYITSAGATNNCQLLMAVVSTPPVHNVLEFAIRAKGGRIRLDFMVGATSKASAAFTLTASIDDYNFRIPVTVVEALSGADWSNLRLKLTDQGVGGAIFVYEVEMQYPVDQKLQVSDIVVNTAPHAIFSLGWARMEIPGANLTYGDKVTFFASTSDDLHVEENGAWTEISKAGPNAYEPFTDATPAHRFVSFGPHIIAAQRGQPLQWREDNTGDFKDLATSTLNPHARLVALCKGHLLAADLDPTDNPGYGADDVVWSSATDVGDFDKSFATRAGRVTIRSTPGQITGLVSGDDVVSVFKRSSIQALEWTEGRTVFRLRFVSNGIGTPFTRSIVPYGQSLYFYNDDGFWYMKDRFSHPERIMGIESLIADNVPQQKRPGLGIEDQHVQGAKCATTGVIVWSLPGDDPDLWKSSYLVVYRPSENSWATVQVSGLNVSCLTGAPNIDGSPLSSPLRSLFMFRWSDDLTEQELGSFSGDDVYDLEFLTKIWTPSQEPHISRVLTIEPVYYAGGEAIPITLELKAGRSMAMLTSQIQTSTITLSSKDGSLERGFFGVDKAGRAFILKLTMASPKNLKSFSGVYVTSEYRGDD